MMNDTATLTFETELYFAELTLSSLYVDSWYNVIVVLDGFKMRQKGIEDRSGIYEWDGIDTYRTTMSAGP
jgi:hypothetical protein